VSGLFSVDPNTIIVLACVIGAIQVAVHGIKRALDVWFDAAAQRLNPIERLADSLRDDPPYVGFDAPEIAPEDEPSWPGKVSPPERHLFALNEPAVVLGGDPARFDLTGFATANGNLAMQTPEETSGRHARVDSDDTTTGLMPAIDEPAADQVPVEEMATP